MSKSWQFFFNVCVFLLNITLCIYGQRNPEVQTRLGENVGSMMKTRLGKDIYEFRSIRYAKAPDGQRRFSNCTTGNTKEMFDCLREVPAKLFGSIPDQFLDSKGEAWYPVVEPEIPGVERFLTDQPNDLIKSEKFYQVPMITGVVRDEMGANNTKAVEAAQIDNKSIFDNLNENWEEIAPIDFRYQRGTEKSKFVSEELKRFYFDNQPISLKNAIGRAYIFADSITIYPVRKTVKLIVGVLKQPIYFSFFNCEVPYTYYNWSNGRPYDDLFYIFYNSSMSMMKTIDKENGMVERLTSIWENFARTSQPIPDNNTLFDGVT